MLFDEQLFQNAVAAYKADFDKVWQGEKYKWVAVKHFQENWNIDAPDFPAMLEEALSKTYNLLVSGNHFSGKMIEEFAQTDPDRVRRMFEDLFDESRDLWERIGSFKKESQSCLAVHPKKPKNHYQDENAILTYLWLKYPEKYYIYKISVLKSVAKKLGSDLVFQNGKYEENLRNFLKLYDALRQKLLADEGLNNLFKSHLTPECYADTALCTLTTDFGYYIDGHPASEPTTESKTEIVPPPPSKPNYWWLVAKPNYWSFSAIKPGEVQYYTLYNDQGHKRKIFQNFLDARAGDMVIGYESTPVKQITTIAQITQPQDGEKLYFKKIEALRNPIDLAAFKNADALSKMEGFANPQGSLFRLTTDEYEFLMDMIREENPVEKESYQPYGKAEFLSEVFIEEQKCDSLRRVLELKKNIILQGAPGVGKTFVARRLAYLMMGEKDDSRVELVQFHQNYSYEDFVLGYKPDDEGFKLKEGVFYKFCLKAANDPDRDRKYFFIIDEINRGNLSKIFGELLMLIEKDYRGVSIKLAYGDLRFHVPDNLYIIGMMNTADRSLAMIDYALRRRFSFFDMEPGFDSKVFSEYQKGLASEKLNGLVETIKELNKDISESLGKGFCIGHSYLCGRKGDCSDRWLQDVVEYDILPMLAEYWFDDTEKYNRWAKRLTDAVK